MKPSGSWFLQIPAQGGDLIAQLGRSMAVTPGEGDGEGELQLFQLMIALCLGTALQMAAIAGMGRAEGAGGMGGGVSHGTLSYYFDIVHRKGGSRFPAQAASGNTSSSS